MLIEQEISIFKASNKKFKKGINDIVFGLISVNVFISQTVCLYDKQVEKTQHVEINIETMEIKWKVDFIELNEF